MAAEAKPFSKSRLRFVKLRQGYLRIRFGWDGTPFCPSVRQPSCLSQAAKKESDLQHPHFRRHSILTQKRDGLSLF